MGFAAPSWQAQGRRRLSSSHARAQGYRPQQQLACPEQDQRPHRCDHPDSNCPGRMRRGCEDQERKHQYEEDLARQECDTSHRAQGRHHLVPTLCSSAGRTRRKTWSITPGQPPLPQESPMPSFKDFYFYPRGAGLCKRLVRGLWSPPRETRWLRALEYAQSPYRPSRRTALGAGERQTVVISHPDCA